LKKEKFWGKAGPPTERKRGTRRRKQEKHTHGKRERENFSKKKVLMGKGGASIRERQDGGVWVQGVFLQKTYRRERKKKMARTDGGRGKKEPRPEGWKCWWGRRRTS